MEGALDHLMGRVEPLLDLAGIGVDDDEGLVLGECGRSDDGSEG